MRERSIQRPAKASADRGSPIRAASRRRPGTVSFAPKGEAEDPVRSREDPAQAFSAALLSASGPSAPPVPIPPPIPGGAAAKGMGPGESLSPSLLGLFLNRNHLDFSHVRIHRGGPAQGLARERHAQALAAGSHIAFASSAYHPERAAGMALLTHELAHVALGHGSGGPGGACGAYGPYGARSFSRHGHGELPQAELVAIDETRIELRIEGTVVGTFNLSGEGHVLEESVAMAFRDGSRDHYRMGVYLRHEEGLTVAFEPAGSFEAMQATLEGMGIDEFFLRTETPGALTLGIEPGAPVGGPTESVPAAETPPEPVRRRVEAEPEAARPAPAAAPVIPAAPMPAADEPLSLTQTVDTMEMSGRELRAELDLIDRWLNEHPSSGSLQETLTREYGRLFEEWQSRRAFSDRVDDTAAHGDLRELASLGIGGVFLQGLAGGMAYELRPNDVLRFGRLLADPSEAFLAGIGVGTVEGIGEDLLANLEGLVALLELANPMIYIRFFSEEAARFGEDPEAYVELRMSQLRLGYAIVNGLLEFLEAARRDPHLLYRESAALGESVGIRAADWFNDDYMRRPDYERGEAIGEVGGTVLTEIVLLFVGPEEWIARGAAGAGQAVRIGERALEAGGRLTRAMLEVMEHVPGLARILRALEDAGMVEGRAARGLDAAGDLARGMERSGVPASPLTDLPAGEGPIRGVIEGGGETTPRRSGHLELVPDEPGPPEPLAPEAAMAVPEETEEALDLAAGAEDLSPRSAPREADVGAIRTGEGPLASAGGSGGGPRRTGPARTPGTAGSGGAGSRSVLPFPSTAADPRMAARAEEVADVAARLGRREGSFDPWLRQADDLVDAGGSFIRAEESLEPGLQRGLDRLEELYQEYLSASGRSGALSRSDWVTRTRNPEAMRILDQVLEPDWRAMRRARLARISPETRLAEAAARVTDPAPWRTIRRLERRYPGLAERGLIPVERNASGLGMAEEASLSGSEYAFEAVLEDGRTVQIDGIGRMSGVESFIEVKSRGEGAQLLREMDASSEARLSLIDQMRRHALLSEQTGIPYFWITDNERFFGILSEIRDAEGLRRWINLQGPFPE